MDIQSPLLTRKEAAKYLNMSIASFDRHSKKINRTVVFDRPMYEKAVLDSLIEKGRIVVKEN